jgi:hypothetical protein
VTKTLKLLLEALELIGFSTRNGIPPTKENSNLKLTKVQHYICSEGKQKLTLPIYHNNLIARESVIHKIVEMMFEIHTQSQIFDALNACDQKRLKHLL